jgi:hypothetical protein
MKITFLGNFSVTYSSESHYLETFKRLGHTVIPLQEGKVDSDAIYSNAIQSDMFFWVHTHGWDTPDILQVLQKLKEKGIPTVGYHLDLWMGIERQKDLDTDPYWNIDHFFCTDKLMVDYLNGNTEIKAHYLPAGVYGSECYMAEPNTKKYPHEIIFVGSRGYHKEWQYRPKLIDWLKETYGERFGHYGGDGLGVVRGHELNQLYASAKVVVGDTLCINYDYPYYFSDRLFETTGRGGFLIFPYIKGLEDSFEIGRELISYPFNDFKYLQSVIDFYLSHDVEREAIRLAGHKRAKENHTYTQRLNYIIETIEHLHQAPKA